MLLVACTVAFTVGAAEVTAASAGDSTCPQEITVFATELELGDAALDPRVVRWGLFRCREVYDVLPGARPGAVVVIHTGAARPLAWHTELRAAGMRREPRPHAGD
ncbi:hypothetical protein [Thermoleophilum album]|uniref:Uncharacterized protein n=1 Tax=Thermoleophilum album TaxID=29539 RepID=A0A1H6FKZ6_THEAL|nr:hypothetical protein [Thermoleophilum album]SEH10464.1 hypothetical protein SAMN02745716_0318 [Thermoleophilum album]